MIGRKTYGSNYDLKKLIEIRELEKRKKEADSRRRRVVKGKTLKQATGSGVPNSPSQNSLAPSNSTTSVNAAIPKEEDKKNAASSKTDEAIVNFDMLIDDLTPLEIDGVSYGKGNRCVELP